MNEILSKLSSYNLFNYLFTGVIFVAMCKFFTPYSFVQENLLIGLFLYYFIGLAISRLGSVLIEPFLKWSGFTKYADYGNFVKASKLDSKLDVLSEANNMYRTLVAVFLSVIFLKIYSGISPQCQLHHSQYYVLVALVVLFLFSYRKQVSYISKRINNNLNP